MMADETYDPRHVGPIRTKTRLGLRNTVRDLMRLIDRQQLHDRMWVIRLMPAIKAVQAGRFISTHDKIEIEAYYLGYVRNLKLPSAVARDKEK